MVLKDPSPRELGFYFALAQVGMEMVVPIGLGAVLDYYVGTKPWGIIIGAVAGLVLGFMHLIIMLNQRNQTDSSKKEDDSR